MRRFLAFLTMMTTCSTAAGGGGNEFIEILIEGGVVEMSITIDPPGGPPTTESELLDVVHQPSGGVTFESGEASGGAFFQLDRNEGSSESVLTVTNSLFASQWAFDCGYTVNVRVHTIEPIILRLLDDVQFSSFEGPFELKPVSGVIDGNGMCPGTYAITIDETLELQEFQCEDFRKELTDLILLDPTDPEVRFTGGGSVFVDGNSTDDQGNKIPASVEGTIDDGTFAASGCTSSGLVRGDAQASGQISDGGNGSYNVSVVANALATQPAGYGGACFIGVFGEGIILDLEKPKAFTISGSGNGAFGVTPTTGSIDGDTMSAGRYRINFNASAQIEAGQTSAVGSIDWTLSLRTPACSGADLALPSGLLDFSDVIAFLSAYDAMESSADLALPIGVLDFSDVLAFLSAFGAGCP